MKFLKFSFVMVLMLGLTGIWSCDDTAPAAPTLAGTWNLISATSNGTAIASPAMTVTINATDADGNGTFAISGTSNVVTFNGQDSGNYTLSGATSITFTTGTATNTATITSSPLSAGAGANWVVSFTANLDQHNDKNSTAYVYTFELQ